MVVVVVVVAVVVVMALRCSVWIYCFHDCLCFACEVYDFAVSAFGRSP